MAWDSSDRRERLPPDWPKIVAEVKKRAGGRCQKWLPKSGKRCPRPGVDVDHIVPGDDHRLQNLRLLCTHHHSKKSAAEGRAARAARQASRKRQPEQHPGLVR